MGAACDAPMNPIHRLRFTKIALAVPGLSASCRFEPAPSSTCAMRAGHRARIPLARRSRRLTTGST